MTRLRLATVCLVSLAACTVALAAQTPPPAPSIAITSPEGGSYVNGSVTLHARPEPQADVVNVTFFIDGRQLCIVNAWPYECAWDAGENIEEHQIRAVAGFKSGARLATSIRTKGLQFDEKVDVPAVQVTVTVTDDAGHFVSGIPRSAFHIAEDGVKQAITNFSSEDVPLELISAVDISGSMAPAMPKLKKAVKDFLGALPAKNQVTLLGFNDTIFTLTRKNTDPGDRVKAVDRLSAWGATALYDVIAESVNMLGQQAGRKALVVFSDGEDQGSHVAINDVERRLQSSDMTLYMIGEGRGTSVDRLKRVMDRLASPTGGRAFTTDSIEELHVAFDELLDELSHQYLLGYQSTNGKRDDSWREIKVDVDGHHSVRARQGYRAVPPK
ncbi:MAG TPA: VWA domain-containing protein [Vicinamibacterales bacterium]|nr:VWA domain-containing protein [Vicinamibacterales bacterium]